MAFTVLQNVQRGVILLELLTLVFVGTFLTIKLIKKRIDLRYEKGKPQEQLPADSTGQKYKQQITEQKIEIAAVKSTALNDQDTCTERLMKKVCEYNVSFNPWLLGMPLSVVTGTSLGFSFVFYLIGILSCILFNTFKVHRACIDHSLSRWAIESFFPISCILLLVNLQITTPSVMLYTLVQS